MSEIEVGKVVKSKTTVIKMSQVINRSSGEK